MAASSIASGRWKRATCSPPTRSKRSMQSCWPCATPSGRCARIASARRTPSPSWPVATQVWARWRATWPFSRRSPRSTAWRCAAATAQASMCWSGTTASTSPIRRWRPRSPSATATRCSKAVPCGWPATDWASSTRRPRRSANWATTSRHCAPPCTTTSSCAVRSRGPMPACRCSATLAGPASASSANPTATR